MTCYKVNILIIEYIIDILFNILDAILFSIMMFVIFE